MLNAELTVGSRLARAVFLSFSTQHSEFSISPMSLTAIILAGGKSTRMKTKRPKPLHEICGKPMLTYILRACYAAGCERILCVVGNGKDEIMAAFGDDKRVHFVEQAEQLGTGHAA